MKNPLIILLTLGLVSCWKQQGQTNDIVANLLDKKENKYFKKCTLFNDSTYIFTLTTIDTTESYNSKKATVVANLYHVNSSSIDTLLNDSLFSRNSKAADPELLISYTDFNFDGVKDILLPAGTDFRENHGFHLYVVNNKSKTLSYIQGFEKIGNPQADSLNQLIESFVLSGQNFYKFYAIDTSNRLVDLGHGVDEYIDNDSIKHIISLERKGK